MKNKLSRRNFLKKAGVGSATVAAGATAIAAEICGKVSVAQTPGPFPPTEALGQGNPGPKIDIKERDADLSTVRGARAVGQVIRLFGKVQDQNCNAIANATVHMWQADDNGHYNHVRDETASAGDLDQNFQYSTILSTDAEGNFSLQTILPKYYDIGGGRSRTSHLHFLVRKLGYQELITQSYFSGEALDDWDRIKELNQTDIILSPRGQIREELKPLIVDFTQNPETGIPEGELTITIQKL